MAWSWTTSAPAFSGPSGFWEIDATDLIRVAKDIEKVAAMTPRMLENALTRAANERVWLLGQLAPVQVRADPRHSQHLAFSFSVVGSVGVREIVTDAPNKFIWVTQGCSPHEIKPRLKKALYWPGIRDDRPVAKVNHPGSEPYPFDQMAMEAYDSMVVAMPMSVTTLFAGAGAGMAGGRAAGALGQGRTRGGGAGAAGSIGGGGGAGGVGGRETGDLSVLGSLADAMLAGIAGVAGIGLAIGGPIAQAVGAVAEWGLND